MRGPHGASRVLPLSKPLERREDLLANPARLCGLGVNDQCEALWAHQNTKVPLVGTLPGEPLLKSLLIPVHGRLIWLRAMNDRVRPVLPHLKNESPPLVSTGRSLQNEVDAAWGHVPMLPAPSRSLFPVCFELSPTGRRLPGFFVQIAPQSIQN